MKGRWRAATYAVPAVCPCGFRVLEPAVPVGKGYLVDLDRRNPGELRCGGCGLTTGVMLVWVQGGLRSGWLPIEIFAEAEALKLA